MVVDACNTTGRNSLKQRYRELAKEFHPDSGTNLDLPDSTINSLMANLTGQFRLFYCKVLRRTITCLAAVSTATTELWMMMMVIKIKIVIMTRIKIGLVMTTP